MKKNIIVYGLRKSVINKLEDNFNISLWINPNRDNFLGIELLNENPSAAQDLINFEDVISIPEDLYHEMYSKYVTSISRQFTFVDGMEPLEPYFSYHLAISSSILLKNQPDIILFANYPHEGIDVILSCLAKFLNIKSIYLSQSLFQSGFYASKSADYNNLIRAKHPFKLTNNSDINLFYMKNDFKRTLEKTMNFFQQIPKFYKFLHFTKLANRYLKFKNQLIFLKNNKQNINSFHFKLPDMYVYFPLHLQPEMTTSCLGKSYSNQLLALTQLRKIVPQDITIILKENPKQNYKQRNKYFYKFINSIPNTIFAPISMNSQSLIDESICVSTISGTVGYEALLSDKTCIIFGSTWYENFEGVFHANLINEFQVIQSFSFSEEHLKKDLEMHSQFLHDGYIDYDYINGHGKTLNENIDLTTYKSLLNLLNNFSHDV